MISLAIPVFLAVIGAVFLPLAGVGRLRLPDLFCRASATTKAATLGVGCVLVAAASHFDNVAVTTRVTATIAFLLPTAQVAAHRIGGAACCSGVPLWFGTVRDERDAFIEEDKERGRRRCVAGFRRTISAESWEE